MMPEFTMTADVLEAQVKSLEAVAAKTTDTCTVSVFIAISDREVQKVLLRKFEEKNVFRGVSCLSGIGIPEVRQVLFQFDCPPGIICLISPSFLVSVNFIEGKVIEIRDPFIPTLFSQVERGSEA